MNFFLGYLNRKKKKNQNLSCSGSLYFTSHLFTRSRREEEITSIFQAARSRTTFTIIIGQLESHDRGDAYPHFDKRNALRYEIEFEKEFVAISNSFKSQRTYIIKIYNFEVIIEVKKKKRKK